jgi:hypothetical protein
MQAITEISEKAVVSQLNADFAFESILGAICENASLENEWIDLLSQLEYVGCRKIMRSVSFDRIDVSILQHISEEASHAFLLKSALATSADGSQTWGKSRLSPVGWRYFQELDRRVSEKVTEAVGCYPAVSWAIERRVLWVYPLYEKRTKNARLRRVLQRILAQETRHGKQFDAIEFPESFRETVVAIERELWEDFCISIKNLLCMNISHG